MLLILLLLELPSFVEALPYIITFIIGVVALKKGVLSELWTSSNSLVTLRTTERDDATKDRDKYKTKCEDLEKENMLLRREITQRIEINLIDQAEIRELKR